MIFFLMWQLHRKQERRRDCVERREGRRNNGEGSARPSLLTAEGMGAVGAGGGDVVVVGDLFGRTGT